MRTALVEILSDATNMAVMRHPGRRFPGVLLQGDTLYRTLDALKRIRDASGSLPEDSTTELNDLIDEFTERLDHYREVMRQENLDLPFSDPT